MEKPQIIPTVDNLLFWEGCRDHVLRYQVCETCERVQLIPGAVCKSCHSLQLRWETSQGLGSILSYTTVYRAPTPAFRADAPYIIALIDMDEGFRLMTNIRGLSGDEPAMGARVRIVFVPQGENVIPVAELEPV